MWSNIDVYGEVDIQDALDELREDDIFMFLIDKGYQIKDEKGNEIAFTDEELEAQKHYWGTIKVKANVDSDDVLDEIGDNDIIDYIQDRGYQLLEDDEGEPCPGEVLAKMDWMQQCSALANFMHYKRLTKEEAKEWFNRMIDESF